MKKLILNIAFLLLLVNTFVLAINPEWISFSIWRGYGSNQYNFIKLYNGNNMWVSYCDYAYNFNGKIIKYDNNSIDNPFDFSIDSSNAIWFLFNGIEKIQNSDTILYTTNNTPIPVNGYSSLTVDTSNDKWFVNPNFGIIKFDNTNWTVYNDTNSYFPTNDVRLVCASRKGDVWCIFNDSNSTVGRFNGINWSFYNSTQTNIKFNFNNGDYICNLVANSAGDMYIRSDTMLSYYSYSSSTWNNINFSNLSSSTFPQGGLAFEKDTIWVGGNNNNLIKIVNGVQSSITMPSSVGQYILAIGIDSNHNKWMITNQDGNYPEISIYHAGGVVGTIYMVDDSGMSVIDTNIVNPYTVSPNPFTGIINISYTLEQPATTSLSLCDMQGNTIAIIAPQQQEQGTVNLQYDASGLSSGAYLLTLQIGGQVYAKKLIKTN